MQDADFSDIKVESLKFPLSLSSHVIVMSFAYVVYGVQNVMLKRNQIFKHFRNKTWTKLRRIKCR